MLMRSNISFQQLNQLRKQYLIRYQQLSFCNNCQIIKSPRTSHCKYCNHCILRHQKHSDLIDMCIGLKNMKYFIQYLFIAMILSLYMLISLLSIAIFQQTKLAKFSHFQLLAFSLFQLILLTSLLLFSKQFFLTYLNAYDNITQVQRKVDIITKKNNPFKNQQYYTKMFSNNLSLFKIQEISDPNTWFEFYDDRQCDTSNTQ